MIGYFWKLVKWSVDGPARFQGRAVVGITFTLMMAPIFILIAAMEIFGFKKGSPEFLAFDRITGICWVLAFLFFVAAGFLGIVRFFQALKDFMLSVRDWWNSRA